MVRTARLGQDGESGSIESFGDGSGRGKIARFVARSAAGGPLSEERRAELEAEALRRMAQQIPDEQKSGCATMC